MQMCRIRSADRVADERERVRYLIAHVTRASRNLGEESPALG
jgi:hypothetical protein